MLTVDSLHFSYPGTRLLTGIHLKARNGEIIGILGRNGSGKSTLLEIIFGIKSEASGYVAWDGGAARRLYTKRGVAAYLPQDSFLPPGIRVRRLIPRVVKKGCVEELRQDPRIAYILNRRVHQLSGGEKRYLELRLLFGRKASLYLLDEPLNEMDPVGREIVVELIKKAAETAAVILTGHVYRDIFELSRRTFVIKDGQLYPADGKEDVRRLGFLPLRDGPVTGPGATGPGVAGSGVTGPALAEPQESKDDPNAN